MRDGGQHTDRGNIRSVTQVPEEVRRKLPERFPALAGLAPALQARLAAEAQVLRVPAGAILFDAKQPCRGFPLVLEGAVRVSMNAPSGREILLYRVEPGRGCILSGGCLLGHSDYAARGVAEDDVTLANLPPALFNALLLAHEPFRRFVFGMYGERLAEVMQLVEEVAFRRLDERLAQLLVHRGPVIEATQQKLADELGSVREIVSRLLRSFEERGWVALERERITVKDPKALAALARAWPLSCTGRSLR
jgi:CRP/FNR family transcriptional regulator